MYIRERLARLCEHHYLPQSCLEMPLHKVLDLMDVFPCMDSRADGPAGYVGVRIRKHEERLGLRRPPYHFLGQAAEDC